MHTDERLPAAVLICHQSDRLDSVALASWLAATMRLAGVVEIRDDGARRWRVARRAIAREGVVKFVDAVALRAYRWLRYRKIEAAWVNREVAVVQARYPAALEGIPRLMVSDPNSDRARAFIAELAPDLIVARCKFILKPAVFELARAGAYALHPGICPEYRNAHGCFWAMANRDLGRVGMTLLKIDRGVDTGPVLLQATCDFDEVRESHTVIQHRVVFENLERIGEALLSAARGEARPLDTAGRTSGFWGQPGLTTYLRWKRAARRDQQRLHRVPAIS
jgi:folate-dependent phosphoribosylglycinamide formyltransferase PurN